MAQKMAAMLLGVALLTISASFAGAVTWKLNSTVQSTWNAWYGYPPDQDPPCTEVGVCVPANTTIPSGTLWYWCGWTTKQRTEYWVNSAGANVTVAMMRQSDLYNCALANVTNIKSCYILTDSTCDTSTKCYNKIYGMSFVDPSCVIVANNDKGSAQVSIQVWQYYDSRRYYGTAFSILLFILVMFAAAGNIGYTCYHQIKKPNHRLDELEQKMRQGAISSAPAVDAPDGTSVFRDASEGAPGPVPAARRALLSQSVTSTDRPVDEDFSVGGTRARNGNNNINNNNAGGSTSAGPSSSAGVGGLIDRMKARVLGAADGGDKKH